MSVPTAQPDSSRRLVRKIPGWLAGVVLVGATVGVYWNSLHAPFLFDDGPAILENVSIRDLSHPLAEAGSGSSVDGRPVVNWSFALNYAVGGLEPWGYRFTNVAIHALAGLLLWQIVFRTLRRVVVPGWLRECAGSVGWGAALLWLLHPLQTESVTCVVQRTESLAGLVYFAALYAFVRATEPAGRSVRFGLGLSVAAAWLGMATKETMATLPLIILLYDRTFVAGTFRVSWQARRIFYMGQALSWLLLAALMLSTKGRGGSTTLGGEVNAWESLLTQSRAIVMYLKLAVWPHPLVVDYGDWITETVRSLRVVWPHFLVLTCLAWCGVYALVRRPLLGFVAAWFFILLGPSSSLVPLLTQMRAEHRMYLPLAAVLVPSVILLWRYAGRFAPWVLAAWALALGSATIARNQDYRSGLSIWTDTVEKKPDNPRARYSQALMLADAGRLDEAEQGYREALRVNPRLAAANVALANLLLDAGRKDEARPFLQRVRLDDLKSASALNNFGYALAKTGDLTEAIRAFERALRADPESPQARNNLGHFLVQQGREEEAIVHFREALRLHPEGTTYRNLGKALLRTGQVAAGLAALEEALRREADSAPAHTALGTALAQEERYAEASEHFARATALDAQNPSAWINLGLARKNLRDPAGAREALQRALALDPANSAVAQEIESLAR